MAEREEWNGECYPLLDIKTVRVDNTTIKANTWYVLRDGKIKEA